MAKRSIWCWGLMLCALLTAACGGDGTGPGDGPGGGGDGPGTEMPDPENPFSHPTGSAYHLPSGVSVVGKIGGTADFTDDSTQVCATSDTVGVAPGFVNLCVHLRNDGDQPVTITLPPGLIFISVSEATQNGVNIWVEQITLQPGENTVLLRLFCGNLARHATEGGEEFTIGPVFDNADLAELTSLIAPKVRDDGTAGIAQAAVWEIGETGDLSAQTKQQIEALPDAE